LVHLGCEQNGRQAFVFLDVFQNSFLNFTDLNLLFREEVRKYPIRAVELTCLDQK